MKNSKDTESAPLLITPETKVGQLLDAYPELEAVLLELNPAFKKLKNPVLRKTVAKVTSLQQAAKVGGLELPQLINRLRKEAGLEEGFVEDNDPAASTSGEPVWWNPSKVVKRIDVRPILDRGEKPVGLVMKALGGLAPGEILELTAGFYPAPLMDMARDRGFETWSTEEGPELFSVCFCRSGRAPEVGEEPPLVDLS